MATQHAGLKRLRAPLEFAIVDGFNFVQPDVRHYFLTHAHSDHTCGLHGSFDVGTVYCSALTARVLRATLGVRQKVIQTIEVGQTLVVEGVAVTALDAGHCPGSLMFLFVHLATGHRALHTGDCRAREPIVRAAAAAASRATAAAATALAAGSPDAAAAAYIAANATADGPTSASSPSSSGSSGVSSSCCNSSGGSNGAPDAAAVSKSEPAASAPSSSTAATASTTPTAAAPAAAAAAAAAASILDVLYLDTTYAQSRWTFPAQERSLEQLAAVVASELEREPATLFIVGSYQVGKEKAIRAVTIASGGRALVPSRRALSLRLCHAWEELLHTEADAPDVRVHVAPLGGMGQEAHAQMMELLDKSEGRYKAVVSFRPTGWTYSKALAAGGAPKPWAENDGRTRLYGVPYSEHSSYTELHALVAALKPATLVPTVNAETAAARDKLAAEFAKDMDATHDRRTLTWHFRRPGGAGGSSAGSSSESGGGTQAASGEAAWMSSVDVAHQHTLWRLAARGGGTPAAVAASPSAAAAPSPSGDLASPTLPALPALAPDAAAPPAPSLPSNVTPPVAQLAEVIGSGVPAAYLARLLADAHGDVAAAVAVHFGPNGGMVPPETNDPAAAAAASASTFTSMAAPSSSAAAAEDESLELPPGTVAWVVGKEFKLYQSREALVARLQALGAAVVAAGTRHSKQEVTLIVAPEGLEPGAILRSACPNAPIVHESWVVRRARALRAGLLAPPPPPPPPKAKAGQKRARPAGDGGPSEGGGSSGGGGGGGGSEKRAARFRSWSAASAQRLERAMSERLYLIERRDESLASPSGLLSLQVLFVVLGSTGNVYEARVCRAPSCTCVDFRERSQICKHLLFVYVKVLRASRESHVLQQRALLRLELAELLTPEGGGSTAGAAGRHGAARAASPVAGDAADEAHDPAATLASPAVRRAYRQMRGEPADAGSDGPEAALVVPRRADDEPCAICFDALEDVGVDGLLAETRAEAAAPAASGGTPAAAVGTRTSHCGLGCGKVFHSACLVRWFEARGAHARRECPACRAAWRAGVDEVERGSRDGDDDDGGGVGGGEGFLNLGALQGGARQVRDASSYSEWLELHRRRREQRLLVTAAAGAAP